MSNFNKDLKSMREGENALDQSVALNRIVLQMLHDKKREDFFKNILLVISLLCNLIICGMFIAYESQFTTTTETLTITQDTEGEGNNVYQSGENAEYFQGFTEGVNSDGEADYTDSTDNEDTRPAEEQEEKLNE